jgi:hypothetical protein
MSYTLDATQLALPVAAGCNPCPFPDACGEARTAYGCGPRTADGVLHHDQPDFMARVREINGFDLGLTIAQPQVAFPETDYLPQVDTWTSSPASRQDVVATTLERWRKRGGWRVRSNETMASRLRLGPDATLILLMFGTDATLEAVWADRARFLEGLSILRPDLVVGPAFSVYPGRPAVDQLYAQTRSLRMFGMLQDHGVEAVPCIDWGRPRDRDAWAKWLSDNPVRTIGVDLQCHGANLRSYIAELAKFRSLLVQYPTLLVNGLAQQDRFADLLEVWPETVFSSDPVAPVAHGHGTVVQPNGVIRRIRVSGGPMSPGFWASDKGLTRHQLFDDEIATMRRHTANAREQAEARRRAA